MSAFQPFSGERIALVGLGKAGLPAARRLSDWGAEVTCWDDRAESRAAAEAAGLPVANPAEGAFRWDALLLSPGIPHALPAPHPAAAAARAAGRPILSDVEYLFRAVRASGSAARFLGITGTNGKSTTTALLHHLLTRAGMVSEAGGNLGPAALSLNILGDESVYTLEMSSYSLERLVTVRFNHAAMINLSPDHLDRHGDMQGYAAAKASIFARQRPEDFAVLGMDDAWTRGLRAGLAARVRPISGSAPQPGGIWAEGALLRDEAGPLLDLREAAALPGSHNAQNAAAAAAVALDLGLSRDAVAAGMRSYPGLPHRQERVGESRGVVFVNDSKATNADSAARALASYDRVVWIAGGMAKDGGIDSLAPLFPRIARALLIGRDAPVLAATLAAHGVPHEVVGTLDAAVQAAAQAAFAGAAPVVLLSPACASWDQFTGYDQRGDRFRALVAASTQERAA
ncbi:UDP-N-acetylmuramoyl-L-alanine--D-glutamate ligase [Paracraurococcus ruber]|uniref:UDP-N-acetylmuramoylalanine--D-glutamate ligase n=1 Tax=Paracraurococcus ruber TaxID=77675 RepID=A0ABS1D140_9PROT|nr:UDP-N-acetylmuramoyl-L-alanine--D-glutamate ligase [Paracraurococcus ruber]MBK1660373.1 UDP-N-acetylmuramoyl-L-alanine--D-glutamate ligase [Paracraurococcus ruber]TDG28519.1 UDP-N-acetylmuramoyl-L-alanine--D-glutamate ligase [Paracraurococcus ruber]